MEKLKKFMTTLNDILFEKNGVLKIIAAFFTTFASLTLFQYTEWDILAYIFFICGAYLTLSLFMMFLYTFIINPINALIERRKEKKAAKK